MKGNLQTGLVRIEEAIAINPLESSYYHNAAGFYRTLGNIEKAEDYFRKAIELKPDYGQAYQGLTEVTDFRSDDPVIEQILQQLQKTQPEKNRSYLHFAAGRIYDNVNDFDKAFSHFQLGNQLAGISCDMDKYQRITRDMISLYGDTYRKSREACGLDSEQPVFIVGMPRSGSTLVEQILSSHPDVFGAGELPEINKISELMTRHTQSRLAYPNFLPTLPNVILEGYARRYLRHTKALTGSTPHERIIDKHPLNMFHVGLIHHMFPRARFIHTYRDALDTCLSCFFQNFSNGVEFSFDLNHLGTFYRIYQRLMEHWQQMLPDNIFNLNYEELVNNQEETSKALVDFCGLKWDESCLDFNKTQRSVRTASFLQVRQPIYKSALGRHKNYTKHLDILNAALANPS